MNVEATLIRLDKQVRLYRNLTIGLLILLLAALTYGAARPVSDVIRTRRIEVLDQQGDSRITLEASGANGLITINKRAGVLMLGGRKILQFSPNLLASDMTSTVTITTSEDGSGLINLRAASRRSGATIGMGIFHTGGGLISYNRHGDDTIHLGATDEGEGFLTIKNRKGAGRTFKSSGTIEFEPPPQDQ